MSDHLAVKPRTLTISEQQEEVRCTILGPVL